MTAPIPVQTDDTERIAVSAASLRAASGAVAATREAADRFSTRRPGTLAALVRATRPRQWLKNVLVAAAPGAAGVIFHPGAALHVAEAFVAFCLGAAGMYLVNDAADVELDRAHPRKRFRPLAAGDVSTRQALTAAAALLVAALAVAATAGWRLVVVLAVYVALTAAYTRWLKRVAIVDIATVAAGFVLRAIAGAVVTGVVVSQWFLILVSFAALFVVAGKRHGELAALAAADGAGDASARPLVGYTLDYLRYVWMVSSGVAITAYCLWAFDQPHAAEHVPWSELSAIPFVLAILRYALLLDLGKGAAPEDVILGDRPLVSLSAAWLAIYALGVALAH